MNKKYLLILLFVLPALVLAIYQYSIEMKLEYAEAFSASKPINGHSWSEIECSSGLCVTADNKVGIGTDNPTEKLEVDGNILVNEDACIPGGYCLSDLKDF